MAISCDRLAKRGNISTLHPLRTRRHAQLQLQQFSLSFQHFYFMAFLLPHTWMHTLSLTHTHIRTHWLNQWLWHILPCIHSSIGCRMNSILVRTILNIFSWLKNCAVAWQFVARICVCISMWVYVGVRVWERVNKKFKPSLIGQKGALVLKSGLKMRWQWMGWMHVPVISRVQRNFRRYYFSFWLIFFEGLKLKACVLW